MGIGGDVNAYKKNPPDVKMSTEANEMKKGEKEAYFNELQEDQDKEEEVQKIISIRNDVLYSLHP